MELEQLIQTDTMIYQPLADMTQVIAANLKFCGQLIEVFHQFVFVVFAGHKELDW